MIHVQYEMMMMMTSAFMITGIRRNVDRDATVLVVVIKWRKTLVIISDTDSNDDEYNDTDSDMTDYDDDDNDDDGTSSMIPHHLPINYPCLIIIIIIIIMIIIITTCCYIQ